MTASFEWYITFSVCSNSWYDLNARCILQTDGSLLNFTATFTGRQLYKFRLKHCLVWAAHTVSINKYTDRAQSCYVPPRPDLAFRLVGQVRFKVSLQVCLDVVEGRQRHRLSEREEQFYSAVSVVSLYMTIDTLTSHERRLTRRSRCACHRAPDDWTPWRTSSPTGSTSRHCPELPTAATCSITRHREGHQLARIHV